MTQATPENYQDERLNRSRAKVLAATAELLFERGYNGASVDEISRRSGVAKTTIYRHWPTRTDLLRDACSRIGTPLEMPEAGPFKHKLTTVLKNLAEVLRTARWTSVLPSIIDAAEREPDMAAMYRNLQHGYSAVVQTLLQQGVDAGELPENTDVPALTAMLEGALFYRRWFSREALSEAFVEQMIAQLPLLQNPAPQRPQQPRPGAGLR